VSAASTRGSRWRVAGYTLTYNQLAATAGVERRRHPGCRRRRARRLARDDALHGQEPVSRRAGRSRTSGIDLPTIRATIGDLFTIADQIDHNGTLYLKVLVKPLVNLIWAAGFLFVFGALVAMWPDAVEQRKLAERYAGGRRRGH